MENKRYIGLKYENGKYYDMYYDELFETEVLVDKEDQSSEIYQETGWDTVVAFYLKNHFIKVEKVRKLKEKRLRKKKYIIRGFLIALFVLQTAYVVRNPEIRYYFSSLLEGDLKSDENNLEYAKCVINHNKTISSKVKEYLLAFFENIMSFDKNIEFESMLRMANRIANSDFSDVNLRDTEQTVSMLSDIINSNHDISTKCLAREFYEYYFNTKPSKKSLLFDALSGTMDSSIGAIIINGGDKAYYAYLMEKYGYSDKLMEEYRGLISSLQIVNDEDKYDFNYYTNRFLANYSENFGFLDMFSNHFNYLDIKNRNVTYNGNIFSDRAIVSISYDDAKYNLYYDKKLGKDITYNIYFNKFQKMIKSFNGNIDFEKPEDRMVFYIYAFMLLNNDESTLEACTSEDDYYSTLYSNATSYFSVCLYNYLDNGKLSHIVDRIDYLKLKFQFNNLNLTEEKLSLWANILIGLQQDVRDGRFGANDYEKCFSALSSLVAEVLGEEALIDFKKTVCQGVKNVDSLKIIKEYFWNKEQKVYSCNSY